jgi:hypothetical protein
MTAAALFALAGYQVTSETAGVRLLGRLGAAIIEIDRWLPAHRDDINLLSRDRPEVPLVVPNLPIEVVLPPPQTIDMEDDSLGGLMRRSMGETLYRDGDEAVKDEEGESHLAVTEPVRWAINLLGNSAHSFWQAVAGLTGVLLFAICAGMLLARQSPLVPLAVGGVIAATASLAVWLLGMLLGSVFDGAIDRELALILRDGAWIGLRNGLAVMAMGFGAAYVAGALLKRREDAWASYETRESREVPPY